MKKYIYLFLVIALYFSINLVVKKIPLNSSNEKFVKDLLQESNHHLLNEKKTTNYIKKLINKVNGIKLEEPITILEKSFAYNYIESFNFSYINNVVDNPKVYIYSTHPTEMYMGEKLEGYDMNNSVLLASVLLQEKLKEKGIDVYIEERSAAEYIKKNNLNYNESYVGTRVFLKDALKKYENLDLIIDLHRDAIDKKVTTSTIEGKDYAKIMFVQNKDLKENFAFANKINDLANKKYPNLSRGLYTKHQSKFNQDLSNKAILLELGGNYNTMNEVVNSIEALANIIGELLNEG